MTFIESEEDAADEAGSSTELDPDALWDESCRNTQAALQEMAAKVSAARKAGLTKPFDPDVDLDEDGNPVA